MSTPPTAIPDSAGPDTPRAWHALPADAVLRGLGAGHRGLSAEEARRRFASVGPNALQAPRRVSAWALLAGQLKNVLIVIPLSPG